MTAIVFFTKQLPSKIADNLIRAGFEIFEALAISEALHLCETKQVSMVVIDASVEADRAKVIQQHHMTLHLKAEATAKDVIAELWQMFPDKAETIH